MNQSRIRRYSYSGTGPHRWFPYLRKALAEIHRCPMRRALFSGLGENEMAFLEQRWTEIEPALRALPGKRFWDALGEDTMSRQPATDQEIRKWVLRQFGFWPEPPWIAHCKRLCSLPVEDLRLYEQSQFNPCPLERQSAVIKAFRHFGMLPPEP